MMNPHHLLCDLLAALHKAAGTDKKDSLLFGMDDSIYHGIQFKIQLWSTDGCFFQQHGFQIRITPQRVWVSALIGIGTLVLSIGSIAADGYMAQMDQMTAQLSCI